MTPCRLRLGLLVLALLALAPPARGEANDAARAAVERIQPSPELQAFLDRTLDSLLARDPRLRDVELRVALLDLGGGGDAPRLAERDGEIPIYPASVVKFVYLMAAYAFQDEGRLRIDDSLDAELGHMIRESSNAATQRVVARLTQTEPGPALGPEAYPGFRERRLGVVRWLADLGIRDLHCVNPTYDGGSDLFGRDVQFLSDASVEGGPKRAPGDYPNRNAMTAVGTVKLLALLAGDRALSAESAERVRQRMRRDPREQPHLAARIAGGAARQSGLEVFAKSGTWGPIYADAGIVREARDGAGRAFALAVFTEGRPPYRGSFIADLTQAAAEQLLTPAAAER